MLQGLSLPAAASEELLSDLALPAATSEDTVERFFVPASSTEDVHTKFSVPAKLSEDVNAQYPESTSGGEKPRSAIPSAPQGRQAEAAESPADTPQASREAQEGGAFESRMRRASPIPEDESIGSAEKPTAPAGGETPSGARIRTNNTQIGESPRKSLRGAASVPSGTGGESRTAAYAVAGSAATYAALRSYPAQADLLTAAFAGGSAAEADFGFHAGQTVPGDGIWLSQSEEAAFAAGTSSLSRVGTAADDVGAAPDARRIRRAAEDPSAARRQTFVGTIEDAANTIRSSAQYAGNVREPYDRAGDAASTRTSVLSRTDRLADSTVPAAGTRIGRAFAGGFQTGEYPSAFFGERSQPSPRIAERTVSEQSYFSQTAAIHQYGAELSGAVGDAFSAAALFAFGELTEMKREDGKAAAAGTVGRQATDAFAPLESQTMRMTGNAAPFDNAQDASASGPDAGNDRFGEHLADFISRLRAALAASPDLTYSI